MDHEILDLVGKIQELPIKTDETPIKTDQIPIKTDQTPIKTDQTPIKTDLTPIELDKEEIKLVKEYYGERYKYVVNLIEGKNVKNDKSIPDEFFAELAKIKRNPFSEYVEQHIIEKGRLVNISEFRFENQVRAMEKDYRYLLQLRGGLYNFMFHEKIKKLLEYAIDNDNKIIEKLCAHKTDKTDYYSRIGADIREVFSTIKSSKTYLIKCIERYPKSVKYLIDMNLSLTYSRVYLNKYDTELLEYAIELDGSCIEYHNDPSFELCKKAVRSNPKAILKICDKGKYISSKSGNIQTELKILKNLAIELNPFLIEYPEMRSHERKIMASSYKRRYWLDKMFDLCVTLHELDLADEILYEIFDVLYQEHELIKFELWNVTRIVKKQELRLFKYKGI